MFEIKVFDFGPNKEHKEIESEVNEWLKGISGSVEIISINSTLVALHTEAMREEGHFHRITFFFKKL